MPRRPDYYAILGIPEDATREEVKRAYRRLAKHYHPDRGEGGDQGRFREIQEAYETLGHRERKMDYDRSRMAEPTVESLSTHRLWQEADPFAEMARLAFFAPHARGSSLSIVLTPEEALRGGTLRLEVPVERHCATCQGTGRGFFLFCNDCAGQGRVRHQRPVRFVIPAGVQHGTWLTASPGPGLPPVGARVEIAAR